MTGLSVYPERPMGQFRKADTSLLVSIILMWGIGMFCLYVCSSGFSSNLFNSRYIFVRNQLISSLIGFAGLVFFAVLPLGKIRKLIPTLLLVTIVLCLCTLLPFIGIERNGAKRWIRLPFFTFQPSELVKITVVLYLANFFDKYEREDKNDKTVFPAVAVFILLVSLVLFQKDLSTGFFVLVLGLMMFFMCKIKTLWIIPLIVLLVPIIVLMVLWEPYRMNRLIAFVHPDEFGQNYNYQANAAQYAIGTGGVMGQGIGTGLSKLRAIPEVQADYIFAGWAEAMGFVGVLLYFGILCCFAYKAYKIAFTNADRFAAIGTFGCMSVIFFQSLVNCAVVAGMLPSTGVPLPFFSSGGSSMIVTLCMCGFMLNTARKDSDSYAEMNNENSEKSEYVEVEFI